MVAGFIDKSLEGTVIPFRLGYWTLIINAPIIDLDFPNKEILVGGNNMRQIRLERDIVR
jgi:hypothetical protein